MRIAAVTIAGVLSVGWGIGLDASASGVVVHAERQTPAYQVTVLTVEGMT